MLRKYHYLNTELSISAQCYGLYDKETLIGFCSVIHFPHPKNPKIKHIHRLVIHPDYQGIGLGKKLLNFVSDLYSKQGFDVSIITSAKNLIKGLSNDEHWLCSFYGKMGRVSKSGEHGLDKSSSYQRRTASFTWKGN